MAQQIKSLTKFVSVGLRLYANTLNPIMSRCYHILAKPQSQIWAPPSALTPTIAPQLLAPLNAIQSQVAGFKVKGRLRKRCKDCYYVMREQRLYVICPTHPRHKQMSMKARDYKSWILTHATQSKVRPY